METLKPSEYFQGDSSGEDCAMDDFDQSNHIPVSIDSFPYHDQEVSSDSEWINSSDEEQQQVTSMLLGGAQTDAQQKQGSFKFDQQKSYPWIKENPYTDPTNPTGPSDPNDETIAHFSYSQNTANFGTAGPFSQTGQTGGNYGTANASYIHPPPAEFAHLGSTDAGYYQEGNDPQKWQPFTRPPKFRGEGENPLIIRVWESLSWLFVFSVHAVRSKTPNKRVPFGANFGGVNLYGIMFWGIPICFMMEELYCNLAVALLTVVDKKKLGSAAADMASFTLVVYLGFWMLLAVITLFRGIAQKRLKGSKEPPLYNLRVISLLCGTCLPAALGGFLWQNQLRKTYAITPAEIFNLHVMPNPKQPSSIILVAAPFSWPIILIAVLALFKLIVPKGTFRKKSAGSQQ